MYECPSLLSMRDELTGEIRDVLIFSPQGMQPLGEKYNNIFQSGYIVGSLDNETLKFTVETPLHRAGCRFRVLRTADHLRYRPDRRPEGTARCMR